MEFLLTELTKYLAILFSGFFALDGLICLMRKTESKKKWCFIRQKLDLFAVQFLCFCTMCFQTKNVRYILLYGVVQILLFSMLSVTPMVYENINRLLLNNMCFLLGTGFIIISRLSFSKAVRQVIIAGAGYLIALLLPVMIEKIKILRKGWLLYGTLGIGLLAVVYILGEITNGSKISFSVYGVSFQPSEFVKIIFVFFLASLLFEKKNFFRVCFSAALAGTYILILAASKDLGAALIFGVTYLVMIFIATNSYLVLIGGILAGGAGSILAYNVFSHIQYRFLAWQDPFAYIDGSGYQIAQSLFAISSGGLYGVGFFNGHPEAIPYVEDDMIFSAICEEMGILFGIILILICYISFFAIIRTGIKASNAFYKLLCTGLATAYVLQIFLTVGGGVKLIPLTGVTLPFISYGGSSVMATIFVFFIVQGIHLKNMNGAEEDSNEYEKETAEYDVAYDDAYEYDDDVSYDDRHENEEGNDVYEDACDDTYEYYDETDIDDAWYDTDQYESDAYEEDSDDKEY